MFEALPQKDFVPPSEEPEESHEDFVRSVLLETGKWKELNGTLYFIACRWFYNDPIPICWHGKYREGIPYPDCLNCQEYDPLW